VRREREIELLERLKGARPDRPWSFAPASMRNPASAYTDPARFERERRLLFRGRPQLVGLADECREPGAWLAAELGGAPLAVVRQADGSLRAFVNICRHRGAPLLAGSGEGLRRIVCPYHGWVYDADGRLLSRPASEGGFDDLGLDCSLHARAVAEKHGLIFVHPESAAPFDVDDALHGAQEELADYRLAGYVHVETRARTWRMNWKLVLDTFTEAYHIRWLHKASIAPHFACDLLFDAYGPNPRAIGLRKEAVEQLACKPREDWRLLPYATAQYFLPPRALLVHQVDHVELWRLEPVDVSTTRVSTSLYAPEAPKDDRARAYWKKNLDILLGVTEREDFPLMEQVQRNLESGALPELVYGRIEPALIHLHRGLDEALAQSEGAGVNSSCGRATPRSA
jgi:phenylpropionate dioxygenase-like ring-hydroxylating dioxygenase large terminal subunit